MNMSMDPLSGLGGGGGGLGMGFALNTFRYDPTTMSVGGVGKAEEETRREAQAQGALGLVGTGR